MSEQSRGAGKLDAARFSPPEEQELEFAPGSPSLLKTGLRKSNFQ